MWRLYQSPQNHSFPSPNLSIFFFFFFDSDSDLQTEEYGSTIITFLWGILIMLIVRLGSLLDYPSGQVDSATSDAGCMLHMFSTFPHG
ncbi:hypothetical protein AAC387_Pa08g2072 [Persea americana]